MKKNVVLDPETILRRKLEFAQAELAEAYFDRERATLTLRVAREKVMTLRIELRNALQDYR
jgi:hypothetical protein